MLTLILLKTDERQKPQAFHVKGHQPEVLGRQCAHLSLEDSRISREHAEVSVQNGVWVIRDLGSSNGTFINGQRVAGLCELEEGDRLQLGRLTLIVGHVEVDLNLNHAPSPAGASNIGLATHPGARQTLEENPADQTLIQPDDEDDVLALAPAEKPAAEARRSPILSEVDLLLENHDTKNQDALGSGTASALSAAGATSDDTAAPVEPPAASHASLPEVQDDEDDFDFNFEELVGPEPTDPTSAAPHGQPPREASAKPAELKQELEAAAIKPKRGAPQAAAALEEALHASESAESAASPQAAAPTREAHETAPRQDDLASTPSPEPSLLDDQDNEENDQDIYAESAGFVTPMVRPESPIDPRPATPQAKAQGDLEAEAAPETDGQADQVQADEIDEVQADDGTAPPVYGLSLGMPAPQSPPAANPITLDETHEDLADDPADNAPQDAPQAAPLNTTPAADLRTPAPQAAAEAELHDASQDVAEAKTDDTNDELITDAVRLLSDAESPTRQGPADATADTVATDVAVVTTPTSAHARADTRRTRTDRPEFDADDVELVEPEAQRLLPRRPAYNLSLWKSVAAMLLISGLASGVYIMVRPPAPITGLLTKIVTDTPPLEATPELTPDATAIAAAPPASAVSSSPHHSDADRPAADPFAAGATLTPRQPSRSPQTADLTPQTSPLPTTPAADLDAPTPQARVTQNLQPAAAPDTASTPTEPPPAAPTLALLESAPPPIDPYALALAPNVAFPVPAGPTLANTTPSPTEAQPGPAHDQAPSDHAIAAAPRRVVFAVDASGSMVDSMNQGVLTWLALHIRELHPDDVFTVLFFRSNEVIEAPPAGYKSAQGLTRDDTLAWVAPEAGNVRPRGKSTPAQALQRAEQYQATDIFILSDDKFGERGTDVAAFDSRELEKLFTTRNINVHAVQFFYENTDDHRLQTIAERFNGTYEFVEEPPFEFAPQDSPELKLLGLPQ